MPSDIVDLGISFLGKISTLSQTLINKGIEGCFAVYFENRFWGNWHNFGENETVFGKYWAIFGKNKCVFGKLNAYRH